MVHQHMERVKDIVLQIMMKEKAKDIAERSMVNTIRELIRKVKVLVHRRMVREENMEKEI